MHPEFAERVIAKLAERTNIPFSETTNHFQSQSTIDPVVSASGALKTVAVSMLKICNDLRWLGSGPRAGIGEIMLPEVQPGSSIMPGKVNPVIAESATMACAQVIGNDTTIAIAGQSGNFELNVMMPVAAHNPPRIDRPSRGILHQSPTPVRFRHRSHRNRTLHGSPKASPSAPLSPQSSATTQQQQSPTKHPRPAKPSAK